jgi:hypothetical protein
MEKLQEINSKYAMVAELKLYLDSTDYHILKQAEGGYQTPQEVLFQRAEARENINAIEDEIASILQLESEINVFNDKIS